MDISILNCLSQSHFKVNRIYFWQFVQCRRITHLMARLCTVALLENVATLPLALKTLGLILFSIPHLPQPPVSSAFFWTTRVDLLFHAHTALHCSPHHLSLWTAAVGFSSSYLPVSQSSYWGSTHHTSIHPSHADIPLSLPPRRKQWVPLGAVTIPSTEPSYSVWQLSPHLLPWPLGVWHSAAAQVAAYFPPGN